MTAATRTIAATLPEPRDDPRSRAFGDFGCGCVAAARPMRPGQSAHNQVSAACVRESSVPAIHPENHQPQHCTPPSQRSVVAPRFIRLRDAPDYLGMDKNRFNRDVRPHVTVIPIGTQGIAFDRLDLDAWAEDHKRRNGRPAAHTERTKPWETANRQVSSNVVGSGTSTNCSEAHAFARALQRAISPKPKNSLRSGSIRSAP